LTPQLRNILIDLAVTQKWERRPERHPMRQFWSRSVFLVRSAYRESTHSHCAVYLSKLRTDFDEISQRSGEWFSLQPVGYWGDPVQNPTGSSNFLRILTKFWDAGTRPT